jgi:amino acid transporter
MLWRVGPARDSTREPRRPQRPRTPSNGASFTTVATLISRAPRDTPETLTTAMAPTAATIAGADVAVAHGGRTALPAAFSRAAGDVAGRPGSQGLGLALILALFAFTGTEGALSASGGVAEPAKSIPRAISIAMLSVIVLYVAVQTVAQAPRSALESSESWCHAAPRPMSSCSTNGVSSVMCRGGGLGRAAPAEPSPHY